MRQIHTSHELRFANVPETGIEGMGNNNMQLYLWDVNTCPCPWYMLLAHKSSNRNLGPDSI